MKKSLKLIVALFSKETFIVRRLRIVFVQNGDYHADTIAEPNKSKTYKSLEKSSGDKRVFDDISWRRNRKIGRPCSVFRER